VPEVSAIRGRNYSLRSMLERMQRFWVCCRQPLPHRITEGLRIHVLELDVTDDASVELAVDAAVAKSGRIDVAINNAGYYSRG